MPPATPDTDATARAILTAETATRPARYRIGTLARIGKPGFKTDVGDSPDIFQLDEEGGPGAVLIVSNAEFPDFAAQGANGAAAAAAQLPAPLARHVLTARATGMQDGRSYALYERIVPLSQSRLLQRTQLKLLRKPVLDWLGQVAAATRQPATEGPAQDDGFLGPCHYLVGELAIPARIRDQAHRTLQAIDSGAFQPVLTLQHGDFWRGNLLLGQGWPRATEGLRFFSVIDWGSSSTTGYPFIDLLRFARSLKIRNGALRDLVTSYANAAGLPAGDLPHYLCAHAGRLGLNRGEFPFDRYVHAIERLFEQVDQIG